MKINEFFTDISTHLSKADSDASPLHSRCKTGKDKFSESCLKSARLHNIAQRDKANQPAEFLSYVIS